MRAREAVRLFREAHPGDIPEDVLVSWISELEGLIWRETVSTHEGEAGEFSPVTLTDGLDRELTAKAPYDGVYVSYLAMKGDLYHNDTARYQTSAAVFAAAYSDFSDDYNRTHAPRGVGELKAR